MLVPSVCSKMRQSMDYCSDDTVLTDVLRYTRHTVLSKTVDTEYRIMFIPSANLKSNKQTIINICDIFNILIISIFSHEMIKIFFLYFFFCCRDKYKFLLCFPSFCRLNDYLRVLIKKKQCTNLRE